MSSEMGALTRLLASLEIARIELEYASADIAQEARAGDRAGLEVLLAKLRLARAALAAAQETLDEKVSGEPVMVTLATAMSR